MFLTRFALDKGVLLVHCYRSITYGRSSTVVMHDCAPMAHVSPPCANPPTAHPSPFNHMGISSKSNVYARKSGTRSLSLISRAEHASQQAVSGSFCGSHALVSACLASCHGSVVFPRIGVGGGGTVILAMFPRGCGDIVMRRWVLIKGGVGVRI